MSTPVGGQSPLVSIQLLCGDVMRESSAKIFTCMQVNMA